MTLGIPDPRWSTETNPCARLCRVLGLDPEVVRGFTLRAYDGDPPTLEVAVIPPGSPGDGPAAWEKALRYAVVTYRMELVPEPDDG